MPRIVTAAAAAALFSLSVYATDISKLRVERVQFGGAAAVQATAAAGVPSGERDLGAIAATVRAQLVSSAGGVRTAAVVPPPKLEASAIESRLGRDVAIEYRSNGTPLQLRGPVLRRPLVASSVDRRDDVATARAFLRENAPLLRISDPDSEFALTGSVTDDLGRGHVRFEQRFEGLAVWPAEVIVHLDPAGSVDLIDGAFVPTPRRIKRTPIVTATRAVDLAVAACGSGNATTPELIVHAESSRRPRLAWKLDVSQSLLKRWTVVVDAASGAILARFSVNETANVVGSGRDLRGQTRKLNVWSQGGWYYLLDSTKKMFDPTSQTPTPQKTRGAIFVLDAANLPPTDDPQELPTGLAVVKSSSATSWPVPDTVGASFLVSETYDYFLERHNRNGIDGNGGSLTAVTRFGKGMANAFWSDERQMMVFGDADTYAASLDVIAHEMTHGVVEHTARLVYKDQSGALNEAMADIFGEMAESRTNGTNDWLLGSQLNAAIRDMKNPVRFEQPAKMSQFVNTTEDEGGVHINSGIINHAFYLLAEGLPGAIGRRDAERIFYRALTAHLTRDSQFVDARVALITSADELFGAGSAQSKKVAEAFDAVEIFGTATPAEEKIPVVSGPDSAIFVYKSTSKNALFLGRREKQSDGATGVGITFGDVAETRPSVTKDGTLAAFVDSRKDACLIRTDGSQQEQCLKLYEQGIKVSNVAISPDGTKLSFVLLDSAGNPDNQIIVVDTESGKPRTYTMTSPALDGKSMASIEYADAMTFTPDNDFLIFDAFNEIETEGAPWGTWSIYSIELDSGKTLTVIPPQPGYDIGWPQLGHTSTDLITFEAYSASNGISTIVAANLDTGDFSGVANVKVASAAPCFTGDDRAIVFAAGDTNATGASLGKVALEADHITASGDPTTWMANASYPVVYRRGTYAGPTTQPGTVAFASSAFAAPEGSTVTVTVRRNSGSKGMATVKYATASGSATAGSDFLNTTGTLTWLDGDMAPKTFQVRLLGDAVTDPGESLIVMLSNASTATLGAPSSAVITISDVAGSPVTTPGKRRSTKR